MSVLAPLVVILGPTASGKSTLAIRLAQQLNGEVLVCDSTQVYRHFDIGTAKVPIAERRGIAHHLIDLVEPGELFTAGEYRRRALLVLADVSQRGKLPILTAGTGLYLRALLEGLADAPERSEELRARLRAEAQLHGSDHLHRVLSRLDPEIAARIGPRDTQKVIRAIEMRVLAGKPVGEIHRAGRNVLEGYEVRKIGLEPPRAALYARIDARSAAMIQDGWLDEVGKLSFCGIPPDAKPFQFIGYSELRAHLAGQLAMKAAVEKIQLATRQFAKRQLTWFRKEPSVHWLAGFGDDPEIAAAALAFLKTPRA
ncbi:MAG TPA: tRNA (adenosine(37)-N6)-dimethylallyltransferase MiaA [Candidatus Acidoferrales bacterium]|jgi:tRNA dimethylallyltransferase|nr:tRNA (adenosine(37)-N6)-dimethylallyltransferase MiaA [Candidatus Acidoferrales bacterium]